MVVVPTYNEPDTIATLLSRLAEHASDADVLVVDDASPDGTTTVVRDTPGFADTIHLLERSGKNGLGAAYRAGFRWALDRGYDVVVEMDADLSHPADRLPVLVRALDDADVAVGSRYVVGGGIENSPWRRRGPPSWATPTCDGFSVSRRVMSMGYSKGSGQPPCWPSGP